MVKIAFWDNCLNERGTTIAIYDYAYYNKKILGNESIILYNATRHDNRNDVIENFKKNFKVFGVQSFNLTDAILKQENCDMLYIIKSGKNERQVSKIKKTVVHCVFSCNEPHGNIYAAISPYIKKYKTSVPVVPHMVNLPEHDRNMRDKLNIPQDAIVYGRYGACDSFDISYVYEIVYNVAKENTNIYFIFMNTNKFCDKLPNIIHVKGTIDLNEKVEFINTCDAMLHARHIGESFGLSIAEFSSKNKPIVTTPNLKLNSNVDVAHIYFLKDKGIWYNKDNLYHILTTFLTKENRNEIAKKDWNAFKDYTPEKVMAQFKRIFID